MRRLTLGVLIMAGAVGSGTATAQPPPGTQLAFRPTSPGLEYFRGGASIGGRRVAVCIVRVRPPRSGVRLVAAPERQGTGATVRQLLASSRAHAAISGGYLKSFYPPLPTGLVQVRGRLISARVPDDTVVNGTVVVRASGSIAIYPLSQASRDSLARWSECIQAGPILVSGGRPALPPAIAPASRLGVMATRAFSRAFIATDRSGRVVLGRCESARLPELADFLARPIGTGGLGCTEAINLSGGGSEGILIKSGPLEVSAGDIDVYLPNAFIAR
jgi:exopolysaccharide biosynthesis protein